MRELTQDLSKVAVSGFEARHYDMLMNVLTFGWYPGFIRRAVADLGLGPGDRVLDMGAGTGRNALLMLEHIGERGRITALDTGEEMRRQFERRCASFANADVHDMPIDEPLPYSEEFDLVFISFVLHGFVQQKRDVIVANACRALKPGGTFAILDYGGFDPDTAPWWVRFVLRKMECPLAEDFVRRDTVEMLKGFGFDRFEQSGYLCGYLRLLKARRPVSDRSANSV